MEVGSERCGQGLRIIVSPAPKTAPRVMTFLWGFFHQGRSTLPMSQVGIDSTRFVTRQSFEIFEAVVGFLRNE